MSPLNGFGVIWTALWLAVGIYHQPQPDVAWWQFLTFLALLAFGFAAMTFRRTQP